MSANWNEIEDLKSRLAETERQLTRIKAALALVLLLLVSFLIPVVGLALFGVLVLGALFAYMYGVVWVAERVTSAVPRQPPPDS